MSPIMIGWLPIRNRSADDYRSQSCRKTAGRVKFAYMSVDFANPTGETLSKGEREQVLAAG